MPTRSEQPIGASRHLFLHGGREPSRSWTDDLPVCPSSGIGQSTNQIYREDGQRCEEHAFEDRSFRFVVESETCLYCVLDGHNGIHAVDFATQRFPAEVLLGQLSSRASDEEVRQVLQQACVAVERGYFESIDDLLAEKAKLQLELPEGLTSFELCHKYPGVMSRLQVIDAEVACGTTAVVALIHEEKLYVANIGDCRALLCQRSPLGNLIVTQLSVDHVTSNEDELLRLEQLGLNSNVIRQSVKLGNQLNTRCLGNYMVKGGYKDFDILSVARDEPIISQPDICGGIPIDRSFSFLLLMSKGLYKSLEEATGTEDVNRDIMLMVEEQFSVQSTMAGVAQAVVDKVVRYHHDAFVSGTSHAPHSQKRRDITFLVRRFYHPFPNAVTSPTSALALQCMGSVVNPLSSIIPDTTTCMQPAECAAADDASYIVTETDTAQESSSNSAGYSGSNTTTTTTSDSTEKRKLWQNQANMLHLDEDGRIEPYVDFTDYYAAVDEALQQKRIDANWPYSDLSNDKTC